MRAHTPRNQPRALVDCGCETTTYLDHSGVEIHFCRLHEAAEDLVVALRDTVGALEALSDDIAHELPEHLRLHLKHSLADARAVLGRVQS